MLQRPIQSETILRQAIVNRRTGTSPCQPRDVTNLFTGRQIIFRNGDEA